MGVHDLTAVVMAVLLSSLALAGISRLGPISLIFMN